MEHRCGGVGGGRTGLFIVSDTFIFTVIKYTVQKIKPDDKEKWQTFCQCTQ